MKAVFIGNLQSPLAIDRFKMVSKITSSKIYFFNKPDALFYNTDFKITDKSKINTINLIKKILYKNPGHILRFFSLYIFCIKNKIDVLHFHGASNQLLALIPIITGIKTITTPQGSDINQSYRGIHKFFTKLLLNSSESITAKSNFMKERIQKITKNPSVHLLNWGLDPAYTPQAATTPIEKTDIINIISPRTDSKNYNIDIIFDAIKKLKLHDYKINFIFVSLKKNHRSADLETADEVYYSLDSEKMSGILSKCDIMISVPSYDGFSTSIMESLILGVLPIISDIPSYKNEFDEDTRLVRKIKSINSDTLAEELIKLCNEISEIRKNKQVRIDYATKNFSRENQLFILNEIYKSAF